MGFIRNMRAAHLHGMLLVALVGISAMFHFYRIASPAQAIFDERHFATYAANYAHHEAVFDIHPPLGKLIFALPLWFSDPERTKSHEFISIIATGDPQKALEITSKPIQPWGNFPYVPLRAVSALFGILLIPLFYLLVLQTSGNRDTALLAALLITFENALLLDSRLILMDSMYLALGVLALVLFFAKNSRPALGGAVWGLALGVKLTAVVFFGPILVWLFFHRNTKRALLFFALGITTLLFVIVVLHNAVVPFQERLALYKTLWSPWWSMETLPESPAWGIGASAAFELFAMFSGYISGAPPASFSSMWYQWPFMDKALPFFVETRGSMQLTGNPIVWAASTIAVAIALIRIKRYRPKTAANYPAWMFLGGYIFSLLPFIVFVRRTTFLYHYFPALLWATALAAFLLTGGIAAIPARRKKRIMYTAVAAVIAGFLITAPLTYDIVLPLLPSSGL